MIYVWSWLAGALVIFAVFAATVRDQDDPDTVLLSAMLSLGWPVVLPLALFYAYWCAWVKLGEWLRNRKRQTNG